MTGPANDAMFADLAAGREAAYERLYDEFGARLLRAARCICGTREDAEDAVQEVFVGLVRAGQALAEVKNMNAYLFSSVHRAAVRRATQCRQEMPIEAAVLAAVAPQSAEPSDRLSRALDALPADQREVVVLKVDGELTFEEVAQLLHISLNTAASRYGYALEKLRASLQSTPETGGN